VKPTIGVSAGGNGRAEMGGGGGGGHLLRHRWVKEADAALRPPSKSRSGLGFHSELAGDGARHKGVVIIRR
jgi:hypothetical protein